MLARRVGMLGMLSTCTPVLLSVDRTAGKPTATTVKGELMDLKKAYVKPKLRRLGLLRRLTCFSF